MSNLLTGRFPGRLYPINPGRDEALGMTCYPDLEALPERVEHVVFCIGDDRVEAALDAVLAHGAKAVTLMSSLVLEDDAEPQLHQRVAGKVRDAGLLVCGANGMGFYNFNDSVWVCGFDTRENHVRGGNVTLISHSGAGMSGIVDCEERIDFNLAVSTGQELSVGMHDYMDFALDLPDTRVIGLFMETARDPAALIQVLKKACERHIPVVALKVGRSELAARLTESHSGAMAGRDDAFQAVFERYGVQRVQDMDELATALILFAQPHPVGAGGLAAIHDSGGERQHLIDLAEEMQVPLADIDAETTVALERVLDPGLLPVNPLDAWGAGGPAADHIMEKAFAALMADSDTAFGAVVHDRAPCSRIYPEYIDYLRAGHAASGKPVMLVSNHQGTGTDPAVVEVTRSGFPVLDGLRPFLAGVRCLLAYRDFLNRPDPEPVEVPAETVARWQRRLEEEEPLDELASGRLLRDFGVPVNPGTRAESLEAAERAASTLGYPVALKSLQPGLLHKTDQHGVVLDIADERALEKAYLELSGRLGPAVAISPMVSPPGTEMLLGMIRDEQFGPVVMLGFGGVNVQTLKDVGYALPPLEEDTARRIVEGLRLRPLLDEQRNRPAADVTSFCRAAARFSVLVDKLGTALQEIDVNPLIVNADGCIAVDALVIGRNPKHADKTRPNP